MKVGSVSDELTFARPAWQRYGECQGLDVDLFIGAHYNVAKKAKAICETCPVKEECLAYALENIGMTGIWGGTDHQERLKILGKKSTKEGGLYDWVEM